MDQSPEEHPSHDDASLKKKEAAADTPSSKTTEIVNEDVSNTSLSDQESSQKSLASVKKRLLKKRETTRKRQLLVVSDYCKNCGGALSLDQKFCGQCGAKRLLNRLTARNLVEDFSERFLNLENAFLKTFIALFTKPEDVINGYILGVRKRYMSAFSYFAVALTLGSIYIFLFKNWAIDNADYMSFFSDLNDGFNAEVQGAVVYNPSDDMLNFFLDFNSFLSFLLIPFYALISKVVFLNYKNFNFVEHIVIHLYAYSQTQIIFNILLTVFIWSGVGTIIISSLSSFFPFFYTAYVLYRVFDLTAAKLILKTLLFLVILAPLSCLFFSAIGTGLYMLGGLDELLEPIKEQHKAREAARALNDSLKIDSIRQHAERLKDTLVP